MPFLDQKIIGTSDMIRHENTNLTKQVLSWKRVYLYKQVNK